MMGWLIFAGIVAGYLAMIPISARFFYLITQHKVRAARMNGKDALGFGAFWPLTIIVVPIITAILPNVEGQPNRLITWIERPTRAQRQAKQQRTAEQERRQTLDQARAEGLPVDITPDTIVANIGPE